MGQYLSSPCTLLELEESTGKKMEYSVGSLQVQRQVTRFILTK